MELRDYGTALRRFWATWVAVTLTGLLVALGVVLFAQPTYQATAQVFVASTGDGTSGAQFVSQRVVSYPDVADSRTVLGPVITQLGLADTVPALAAKVSATNPTGSSQIDIAVTDTEPVRAAQVANAVAQRFRIAVQQLESSDSGTSRVLLTVTNPATTPLTPVFPRASLLLPLGLVVGLALGAAAAIVRSRRDPRVHDAEDARSAWGAGADELVVLSAPARRRVGRRRLTGRPSTLFARQLEPVAEQRAVRVAVVPASPRDERRARSFAEDVAAELGAWGVPATVSDGLSEAAGRSRGQVQLVIGSPETSLPEWRRLTSAYDGVAIVVPPGRVDRAELRELRSIFATAGVRTLAVVLPTRRRGEWSGRRTDVPRGAAPQQARPTVERRPARESTVSTAS